MPPRPASAPAPGPGARPSRRARARTQARTGRTPPPLPGRRTLSARSPPHFGPSTCAVRASWRYTPKSKSLRPSRPFSQRVGGLAGAGRAGRVARVEGRAGRGGPARTQVFPQERTLRLKSNRRYTTLCTNQFDSKGSGHANADRNSHLLKYSECASSPRGSAFTARSGSCILVASELMVHGATSSSSRRRSSLWWRGGGQGARWEGASGGPQASEAPAAARARAAVAPQAQPPLQEPCLPACLPAAPAGRPGPRAPPARPTPLAAARRWRGRGPWPRARRAPRHAVRGVERVDTAL